MKIKLKFTISFLIIIFVIIFSGIFLSYSISNNIKENALVNAKNSIGNFVQYEANEQLDTNDFTPINFDEKEKTFTDFFAFLHNNDIARILVLSSDQTVIYSDEKDVVGKRLSESNELQETMKSEIATKISEVEGHEEAEKHQYGQLMVVDVPVYLTSDTPVGIIKTYFVLDEINASITKTNELIFSTTIITLAIIITIVTIVYHVISKTVINQIIKLRDATNEITKGNLDKKLNIRGSDEIIELAAAFNSMIDSIKKSIELEKELAISKQDLKNEKLTTIGLLASRLAHDLRNPLSVIKNIIELLEGESMKRNDINEKKKFDQMNRAIARISHQINDVMEFVRIKPLKLETTSMYEIVKSAVQSIQKPENIVINLPTNDLHVLCDITKLEVVFINILLNAIQAIGEKGAITIRFKEKTDSVRIEVENDGTDIPNDVLPKIFDPLFTTKQSGTGLGLFSCKNIIEQHDGTINVKNNPTTFIIILPKLSSKFNDGQIRENYNQNSPLV